MATFNSYGSSYTSFALSPETVPAAEKVRRHPKYYLNGGDTYFLVSFSFRARMLSYGRMCVCVTLQSSRLHRQLQDDVREGSALHASVADELQLCALLRVLTGRELYIPGTPLLLRAGISGFPREVERSTSSWSEPQRVV